MDRKNKAARTINTALGLIVILAVVLLSPLFGYGRGFASKEQRMAAAENTAREADSIYSNPAATPRPTPEPTPMRAVLPSAPPTPEPTPIPTPRPTAVQQTVQQSWQPQEQYWSGEDYSYEEETYEESSYEEPQEYLGIGEQPVANESGNVIVETSGADLVFQGAEDWATDYQPEPQVEPQPEPQAEVYVPTQQDTNEGEYFLVE